MFDKIARDRYRAQLLRARVAIPRLLDLFAKYDLHATWATVGLLFCENKEELLCTLPTKKPAYANRAFSPYEHLETIGRDEDDDPLHYAPSLIRRIASYPHQEIGTHTFSHYYCLERGQGIEAFSDDLRAAQHIAARHGYHPTSLVFPRNQVNPRYLAAAAALGITTYRGNPDAWVYRGCSEERESLIRRGVRLADAYLNVFGHNTNPLAAPAMTEPVNVPASRFLRLYSPRLNALTPLHLRRLLADMTHAARTNTVYHLWWHPEGLGCHLPQNLAFLSAILDHFAILRADYGMTSLTMHEVARGLGPCQGAPIRR
jgi:peptidoglycan/xylan/chitin deacetylase (PgdA/CDA1 family)